MQTQIRWNTKELTKDLPEDESGFYKAIGELLPEIEIPNKLYISCHMGDAEFLLKQRGTYTKNGEVKPSLYVTEEYNNIYGLTPSTYSDAYLTCINPESNNYKYYWLRPSADAIHATYGRIGSERGEMFGTKELKNPYEPHLFWIRYYEKLSKGYIDQSDVYLSKKPSVKPKKKVNTDPNDVSAILYQKLLRYSRHVVETMVPMIGDNRTIVKEGLEHINQRDVTFGLQILLDRLKLNHVTEEDYGFLIGPVMNASGRMLDDGPIDVVNMVTSLADPANPEFIRKTMYLQDLADELVERNEKRKEAVEKDLIEAENIIREKTLMNNNPLIVYSPNFWEGTIGILAGKLAEKYQVPCLVFTKSSAKGIAKGSGRTYGNIHLKYLLDKASDLLVGYGGHAAAAGMSIKIKNISILQHRLKSYLKTEAGDTESTSFYDMEISENDMPSLIQEIETYAPYGVGNPKPVFRMDNFACSPVAGKFYKDLGENQICTKFTGRNLTAIGFHLADDYKKAGEPKIMNIIGTLSRKKFQYATTIQMEILDFENAEDHSKSEFYMDLEKTLSFI